MEKAYDLKDLQRRLKSIGLEAAEETLKSAVGETFEWLTDSAQVSTNKVDDIAAPLYPQLKGYVLEQAEKINPED